MTCNGHEGVLVKANIITTVIECLILIVYNINLSKYEKIKNKIKFSKYIKKN